jgi:hypothetical protein
MRKPCIFNAGAVLEYRSMPTLTVPFSAPFGKNHQKTESLAVPECPEKISKGSAKKRILGAFR